MYVKLTMTLFPHNALYVQACYQQGRATYKITSFIYNLTKDFIKITIGKVLYRYHVPVNTVDDVEAPKRKEIFISLPFLGPISIIVKRKLLRQHTISIRV